MKCITQLLLAASALLLMCSCEGMSYASFHDNGNPKTLANIGATGQKADASAREQIVENPNTGFRYVSRTVQQNPDGTVIPVNYTNKLFWWKGLREFFIGDRITKQGEADALRKGTADPNLPNPNDGIVETEGGVFTPENTPLP